MTEPLSDPPPPADASPAAATPPPVAPGAAATGSRTTRDQPNSLPAVLLISAAGAILVGIAALVLLASQWTAIPAWAKVGGLWTASACAWTIARRERHSAPVTVRALDRLVAGLAATACGATALNLGGYWPQSVMAAGAAAAMWFAWRDSTRASSTDLAFAATGLALLAAGIAAESTVPAAVIVAAAAIPLLLGLQRRLGRAAAVLAMLSPLAAVPGLLTVGNGTLTRIDALGPRFGSGCLVASTIGCVTLLADLTQRRDRRLSVWATLLVGWLADLAIADNAIQWPAWSWPTVAALVFVGYQALVLQLAGHYRQSTRALAFSQITEAVDIIAALAALAMIVAPTALVPSFAPALLLAALAFVGASQRERTRWPLVLSAGLVSAALSTVGTPVAISALCLIGVGWLWRRYRLTLAGLGYCMILSSDALSGARRESWPAVLVALVAAGSVAVVKANGTGSDPDPAINESLQLDHFPHVTASLQVAAAAVMAASALEFAADSRVAMWVGAAMLTLGIVVQHPNRIASLALLVVPSAGIAALVFGSLLFSPIDWVTHGSTALVTSGAVVAWKVHRSLMHVAAAAAPLSALAWLDTAGAPSSRIIWLLLVLGVAVAGLAFVIDHVTALDTAGAAMIVTAWWAAALWSHATVSWFALTLLGLAAVLHGLVQLNRRLIVGGVLGLAGGIVGMSWSSDAIARAAEELSRYGVTTVDLWVAATMAVLATLGWTQQRFASVMTSWLTWTPTILVGSIHLLITGGFDDRPVRSIVSLSFGVALALLGASRRTGAPLVLGVAHLGAVIVLVAHHNISRMPVWAWLAIAGAAMVGSALAIEHRSATGSQRDFRTALSQLLAAYR